MICLVGGSGFIGTRLAKRLQKKNESFYIVDKVSSVFYPNFSRVADVRYLHQLRESVDQCAVLINLAAEHRDNVSPKSLYDDVNVVGAENVCEVAREKEIKYIVFVSSVAVYGFAPPNTDESGTINYFNDYGRTKWLAEKVYKAWQKEDPQHRTLIIVRPTVVFGEQNRGNVYNLLRQISSGRFMMVGNGKNKKSMAYVENVAAFLEYCMNFVPGVHVYNYVDKPDIDMNALVSSVKRFLGKAENHTVHLPYAFGYVLGLGCDLLAKVFGRSFAVSSIRVKKFCSTTQFNTSIANVGFAAPVTLDEGLERTVKYEFLEDHSTDHLFFTE